MKSRDGGQCKCRDLLTDPEWITTSSYIPTNSVLFPDNGSTSPSPHYAAHYPSLRIPYRRNVCTFPLELMAFVMLSAWFQPPFKKRTEDLANALPSVLRVMPLLGNTKHQLMHGYREATPQALNPFSLPMRCSPSRVVVCADCCSTGRLAAHLPFD